LAGLASTPTPHRLGGYSYDVLLHIAPSLFQLDSSNIKPLKVQADQRFLETLDGLPSPHGGSPEAPVYVIFTSGSTGRPKGVKVKTQSLINLLYWYRDLGKIGPGIRVLQVIPSSFDASIKNYLATLLFGGTLVLLPETVFDPEVLLQAIAHHQIHILNPGVPSMFYPVLELAADREYRELESLKLLALGGEAPIMARLRPWLTHPNCRTQIVNIYGPTECTDIALCYGITSADWKLDFLPPIGEPLPNLRAYILDEHNNPQPLGAMGELCLAGEGLAIGYVGDREQTAHTFVPDPFFPGQQMYRTGDLAYRRTDGAVVYAGRRDNQLKIRGVRIELEEIEARLRTYPGVREAAVVALPDGEGMLELIGYIDASSVKVPSLDLLREWLAAELPAPMVPAHIYLLEEFPRNPNGKIDRRRLPSPKQIAAASDSHQLPQLPSTTTEQTLLAIWREVLSHPNLGVHDNFFDAGGHSLKTAVMASRIRQTLGVSFSVSQVYEAQTIVAQAKLIEAERTRNGEFQSNIVRLLNHKGYPLLFCFPPISANAWSFLDLAQELASTYSVYAFDFLLATDRIQQYAEAIRAITGNQSFALIGYSAGASLAFSVTQHLEAEGVPVANLLILDSIWRTVSPAYSEAYIEQIVTYYLENPRFRDLFTESVAQQFWAERIRAFARVYGSEQDTGTIAAPITLIAAAEGSDSSNIEGWQIASRHSFQQIQGVGHHDCLLERPHVVTNAALIHNIINISFKEVQS
jgi:amino acid adenylation domain-containing protein